MTGIPPVKFHVDTDGDMTEIQTLASLRFQDMFFMTIALGRGEGGTHK